MLLVSLSLNSICMPSCLVLLLLSSMSQNIKTLQIWPVVLWQFFMGSTSIVIAHGAHMLIVSLIQAGTAKIEKPLVRYQASLLTLPELNKTYYLYSLYLCIESIHIPLPLSVRLILCEFHISSNSGRM
ncbi:hypothetical protein S83_038139 [Arachis hypogaea]